MSRLDEIKQKLAELEEERTQLTHELRQVEREDRYKSYLIKLVEADVAAPASTTVDAAFKDEVLRWLGPSASTKPETTIKGWVLSAVAESPEELTPADLRNRFKSEFGPKRVASLRQYLTQPFGLVKKSNGKLVLTKTGKSELAKLKRTDRG